MYLRRFRNHRQNYANVALFVSVISSVFYYMLDPLNDDNNCWLRAYISMFGT